MDYHRFHGPKSGYQKGHSASRRKADDGGRNRSEARPGQNPLSLSTRRELYERDFPVYKQPVEVGCFSLNSERSFFNDDRQMRYYAEPDRNPDFDLRDGYRDRYVKRDDSVKEKLDHLLRWILANRLKLISQEAAASSW